MVPTHPIDTKGRPIILIGLMGCGKTTVGKALSMRTGMPLLDTDAIIEEQYRKTIPQIFAEDGENTFRTLETTLLRYLYESRGKQQPAIISTGGGIIMRPENRQLLHHLGYVVWLNVSVSALLSRTAHANNRPLLEVEDRRATLQNLFDIRRPMYARTAHLRLNTTRMDVKSVVREICCHADRYFHHLPPLEPQD